jgi:hypothetical protein
MSAIVIPGSGFISALLIGTKKALTPSFLPFTIVCAKTREFVACLKPFEIQYFWLSVEGLLITNYFVFSS